MAFPKVLVAAMCGIGLVSVAHAKTTEVNVIVPEGAQINVITVGQTTTVASKESVKKEAKKASAKDSSKKEEKQEAKKPSTKEGFPKTFCLKPGQTLYSHLGNHALSHKVAKHLGFSSGTSGAHVGKYTVHDETGKSSFSPVCK